MKYMVMVNGKFMVTVDKDGSMAAAEHEILDNYDGIQAAQAFDRAALHTNYFVDVLQYSETISTNELQQMSDRYSEAYRVLARKRDTLRDIDEEITRLMSMIDDLRHDRAIIAKEEEEAVQETIEAKKALNWRD